MGDKGSERQTTIEHEARALISQFNQYSHSSREPEAVKHPSSVTHGHTLFCKGTPEVAWSRFHSGRIHAPTNTSGDPQASPTNEKNNESNPPSTIGTGNQNAILSNTSHSKSNLIRQSPERPQRQSPKPPLSSSSMKDHNRPKLSRASPRDEAPSFSTPSPISSRLLAEPDIRRRSSRQKNHPVTYNLRVLSGTEDHELSQETSLASCEEPIGIPPALQAQDVPKSSPSPPDRNLRQLLLNREVQGRRANMPIYQKFTSGLRKWKSWTEASGDVMALAWSPDGTRFAAGATASPDVYNRDKNMVVGDLVNSTLYEIPDHWTPHPCGEGRLYASITETHWVGDRLYTASYDNTVKIWDVATNGRPSQVGNLQHDSKVIVMAVSKFLPNLVATGSKGFQLWNTQDQVPSSESLQILRSPRQRSGIDFVPTTLVWGAHGATKQFLAGGMKQIEEEYKISSSGHTGLWQVGESSVLPRKLDRGSQNVFDIQWDSLLPRLAIATTAHNGMDLPPGSRTAVQVYDYVSKDDKFVSTSVFPCPAADINVLSFCPMGSTYVTAGCTNGQTYVWDTRNPTRAIHQLGHGKPIDELNHEHTRELTDNGVTVTLWGSTMDQFYTGGTDGCLKRWDIRRSPEDALIDVDTFEAGIVRGAFSEDKSHLVISDHRGGISVLSSAPHSDPDNYNFAFEGAPPDDCATDSVSGAQLCKELLSSGQLERHPIYGPVQGPHYNGPYALWARGISQTPSNKNNDNEAQNTALLKNPALLRNTPLLREFQLRQFEGAIPQDRDGLDDHAKEELIRQMSLARYRNVPRGRLGHILGSKKSHKKRRRSETGSAGPKKKAKIKSKKIHKKIKMDNSRPKYRETDGVIDLTEDSPDLNPVSDPNLSSTSVPPLNPLSPGSSKRPETPPEDIEDRLEEDYWWPDSSNYDANICESD